MVIIYNLYEIPKIWENQNLMYYTLFERFIQDLQSFKTKLQSLWKQIEEFKHSCHNSTSPLVKEQAHLEADLNASKRVIRMHKDISSANCSCKNSNLKTLSQKEEATKNSCNYDDVEDFCTLLAKTGKKIDLLLYITSFLWRNNIIKTHIAQNNNFIQLFD